MQTEKANNLCAFLNTAIKYFEFAVEQKEKELPNYIRLKNTLTEETFSKIHQEYMNELAANILEYRDIEIAYKYMSNSLNTFREWEGFNYDVISKIMSNNHDVQFLLKLKLSIEKEIKSIKSLFIDYFMLNSNLRNYFSITISKEERDKNKAKIPEPDKDKPAFDERFDFDKMLKECSTIATDTLQKIDFINNRIYDLKQWQLRYDKEETFKIKLSKHESDYIYTTEYYPKFEELCKLELQRLEKKLELEKKTLTHKALEKNPIIIQNGETKSNYKWTASDTDLLELIAALYQNKSIERKDGKALTRKELIDYFQTIFSTEIKDVEGKLTRATARKINMTPFLDSLKIAFVSYAEEKEEKQRKRK